MAELQGIFDKESNDRSTANKPVERNNVADFGSQTTRSESSPASGTTDSSRSSGTSAAAATARGLYDQAKETAGEAYEAVSEKAVTRIDEQKSTLSDGLATVADSIRQVSDNLGSSKTDSGLAESAAKYTQTAAKRIDDVAGYFENKSVTEMARDLEGFARKNPMVFLGAAFGLGFIAARFFKSGPPRQFEKKAGMPMTGDRPNRSLRSKSATSTGESDSF